MSCHDIMSIQSIHLSYLQTSALLELSRRWAPDGNDFSKAVTIGVTIIFTSEYASRLGQFNDVHTCTAFSNRLRLSAVNCPAKVPVY